MVTTTWGHVLWCLKDSLQAMGLTPNEYDMTRVVDDALSNKLQIHTPHKGQPGKYEIVLGQNLDLYKLTVKEQK